MAIGALVVGSVVLGLLVVAVVAVASSRQGARSYSQSLNAKAQGVAVGVGESSGVRADQWTMAGLVVIATGLVAAMLVVRDPVVFLGAIGVLLVGFFVFGVYHLGRSHGMGTAHAIGLSAWFLSILLAVGVAVKLLVA